MGNKSSEAYFRKINNIFHSVMAVPLLAFGAVYLNIENGNLQPLVPDYWSNVVVLPLVSLATVFVVLRANGIYKNSKAIAKSAERLSEKLDTITQGIIQYNLWLGLASLLVLLGYFVTANKVFMIGYMLVLSIQSFNKPSPQKISEDLRLPKAQREVVLQNKPLED